MCERLLEEKLNIWMIQCQLNALVPVVQLHLISKSLRCVVDSNCFLCFVSNIEVSISAYKTKPCSCPQRKADRWIIIAQVVYLNHQIITKVEPFSLDDWVQNFCICFMLREQPTRFGCDEDKSQRFFKTHFWLDY